MHERASSIQDLEDCSPLCTQFHISAMESPGKNEKFTATVETSSTETSGPDNLFVKECETPEPSDYIEKELSKPRDLKFVASVSMENETPPAKLIGGKSQANCRANRLSNSVWIQTQETDSVEDTPPRISLNRESRNRLRSKPSRTYYFSSP